MKITYTPNPLTTIIELDEHEQAIFKLKLKIEEYEEMIFSAHWLLRQDEKSLAKRSKPLTLEQAKEQALDDLDPDYWCADNSKLDQRVNELFEYYMGELKGSHGGDCTCFPATCCKCVAESMLGLDTLKGLGKHEGSHLYGAFNYKEGDEWKQRSIDEVLDILEAAVQKWETKAMDNPHSERWKREDENVLKWLKEYKEKHFKKD